VAEPYITISKGKSVGRDLCGNELEARLKESKGSRTVLSPPLLLEEDMMVLEEQGLDNNIIVSFAIQPYRKIRRNPNGSISHRHERREAHVSKVVHRWYPEPQPISKRTMYTRPQVWIGFSELPRTYSTTATRESSCDPANHRKKMQRKNNTLWKARRPDRFV